MSEKHILHIEDNFHNRRIVRKILERHGYRLHEAADGLIGFNMIQELRPPMVLLDISLPGMDGIEIAQRVKGDDDLKHIIIIAVTASAMQGDRERFLAAGCDDYLSKPFRSIDLLDLVNQYYAEIPESYMTPARPKDVIHPIEERSVSAEPESWPRSKQRHEGDPEPYTPITEETLAEPERQFFTRKEDATQAEETSEEAIETSQDNGLLKTASLEGLLTNEELDNYLEGESAAEKKVEGAEEAWESMPARAFAGEAESEEKEEEDDEAVTWVMPRNAMETPPIEEEHPMEEPAAEPAGAWEDGGVNYKTFLEEISSEDALDEEPIKEAPEPDAAGENDETTQVWRTPIDIDEFNLDTDFLRPSVLEEAPGEYPMEETPEAAATEESEAATVETLPAGVGTQADTAGDENDETTQVWRTSIDTDEFNLDTDFLQPSVLKEAPDEYPMEETPEAAATEESEAATAETLPGGVGMQAETSGEEESDETTQVWRSSINTDELDLDTDFLQPSVLEEAPDEVKEESTPTLVSPTIAVEKLMSFSGEEAVVEPEPDLEEEQATPAVLLEELRAPSLEGEEVLTAEPAPETKEEVLTEAAASVDESETPRMDAGEEWDVEKELEPGDVQAAEPAPETEEEALTEAAASIYDEIETIRMGAGEEWDLGKELEVEDLLTEEPELETTEEVFSEPATYSSETATTTPEAEDVLTEGPAPESKEEMPAEAAYPLYDEAETPRMDSGEEWGLEKELEVEEYKASQKIAMHSRLDDTSPLREEVLEASMAEEPLSESPSNGSGREEQSQKKEGSQRNDLTDQVVRMINPEMIRPVDPNVDINSI